MASAWLREERRDCNSCVCVCGWGSDQGLGVKESFCLSIVFMKEHEFRLVISKLDYV